MTEAHFEDTDVADDELDWDFARMHILKAFMNVVPIGFIKLPALYGASLGSSLYGNVRTERLLLSSMKIFHCL